MFQLRMPESHKSSLERNLWRAPASTLCWEDRLRLGQPGSCQAGFWTFSVRKIPSLLWAAYPTVQLFSEWPLFNSYIQMEFSLKQVLFCLSCYYTSSRQLWFNFSMLSLQVPLDNSKSPSSLLFSRLNKPAFSGSPHMSGTPAPNHLIGHLLDSLQYLNVFPVLGSPDLGTVL